MPKNSPSRRTKVDQLNQAIESLLAGRPAVESNPDASLYPLLQIAQDLRDLPRQNFKARLKSELERKVTMPATAERTTTLQQTITTNLRVKNAEAAIEFYKQAFGASEILRFNVGGRIAHAELALGNSVLNVAEQSPEYGFLGPEALGGSPVQIEMWVADPDAAAERAIAAGAKLFSPVVDQFYGVRSGQVADPFGYTWTIAARKEEIPLEEMYRRFDQAMRTPGALPAPMHGAPPEGFHTLTPYLMAQDVPALIDFLKSTFDAQEIMRNIGSAGGIHAEVRIADSMLMIGGGGPGLAWAGESQPMAFHVYVPDVDETFGRAIEAGGEPLGPVVDQSYGERSGSVKDPAGNYWYIATYKSGASYVPEKFRAVTPYLHPLRADPVIGFLRQAFGASDVERYASPEGVVQHAALTIGDSRVEMGEAHGRYQPMPARFYMYVPDVDAMYRKALIAGAVSTSEPADQQYGDRMAGVKDVFGNQWYLATHLGGR